MRVSRAQAEKNRDHVIDVASRLFRERGFDGIGLAGLMKAAGLTHGAFYGQFQSKLELEAAASERALAEGVGKLSEVISANAEHPVNALANYYLSKPHRDAVAGGCALAALAPDAAREDEGVRSKFTEGVKAYLELFASALSPAPGETGFDDAVALLSTFVGALALARTVNDDELSRRILAAATTSAVRHFSPETEAAAR